MTPPLWATQAAEDIAAYIPRGCHPMTEEGKADIARLVEKAYNEHRIPADVKAILRARGERSIKECKEATAKHIGAWREKPKNP